MQPRSKIAGAVSLILAVVSCGGTPFAHGWSSWRDPEVGCIPRGTVEELVGELRPEPPPARDGEKIFGGTWLVLANGEPVVVAYGATLQHERLAGKRIRARGRFCEKQGQAVNGRHFDIDSFVLTRQRRNQKGAR